MQLAEASIQNAYLSVELKAGAADRISAGLLDHLNEDGVACERASQNLHVSLGYASGAFETRRLQRLLEKVAAQGFSAQAHAFEILEGQSTPFDYLVLSLEMTGDLCDAFTAVQSQIEVQSFAGGFRAHVSLLKFPKGSLTIERRTELVRELNASWGAAFALGCCARLEGARVACFNPERCCCLEVAFAA